MALITKEFDLKDSEDRPIKLMAGTLPGTTGIRLGVRITKLLTPIIKALPDDAGKDGVNISLLSGDIKMDELAEVLTTQLDDENIVDIILKLFESSTVDGKDTSQKQVFDQVFAGEYGLLIDCLKHILGVNFKTFFGNGGIGKVLSTFQLPSSQTKKGK
jgi:hypothetical protein